MAKFREMKTASGKLVLAGKDAESNEKLIEQVGKDELVFHTKAAGSPFVNIKEKAEKITKQDIKEAAIFCARFSQAWKKAKTSESLDSDSAQKSDSKKISDIKKDVEVHYFLGKDIFKVKNMKLGTFGVVKNKKIIVKKSEAEESGK